MSFRRYENYRDSGVEWLGKLPDHWKVERLKRLCDVRPSNVDKKSYDDQEPVRLCNYTDVYYAEQITPALELMEATASAEQIDRFGLRAGDVIVTKDSETADDIAISAHVPETMPGVVCGYHLALLRPQAGVEGAFIKRCFDSHFAKASVAVRANGLTRVGLGQYALDNLLVPTPPEREQRAIVAFLDRETAKIDALVEEQRRIIELLKEKRQAVISHAVTKGLDPSAAMNDSGVEWLDQIPAHWAALQLGRLCRQVADGPHFSPRYVDDGVMFLSARNIRVDGWSLDNAKYVSEADYREFCKRIVPEIGDVLYTKGGTTGIARVVDLEERFQVWVHVAVLKLHKELVDSQFLTYALNGAACYAQAQLHTRGATNQDLGLTRMIRIWLALPPMDEQTQIASNLDDFTRGVDRLIGHAQRAVALYEERRAALISAAVTGKIDVRERAAAPAELEPA